MAPDVSPISPRDQYARRLVRAKLANELSVLNGRDPSAKYITNGNITMPLVLPSAGSIQIDNLPGDPCYKERKSADASRCDALAHSIPPRKVCIIGAGIAGLYIATILDDLRIPNLTYDIFEASSRVGGRIFTHRFSMEPHDYYDVGAMRFPNIPSMGRLFDLFRRMKVPTITYHLSGKCCPSLFNDRLLDPDIRFDPYSVSVSNGGNVPDDVVDRVDEIMDETVSYVTKQMAELHTFEDKFNKLMEVDDLSTRDYLKHGGKDGKGIHYNFFAVQWIETQSFSSNSIDLGFSELVLDSLTFDTSADWFCIEGGSSLLTDAMQRNLTTKVQTEARVSAISINRISNKDDNMSVQIASKDESLPLRDCKGYSTVFSTTTLGCLQRMDLRTLELHPSQKDAIRCLAYDNSAKVALKFSYPWWIVDCGITEGGMAYTDLPLRMCIYPSYNLHDSKDKPAVLLASYTWSQDATRIGSLVGHGDENQLVECILRDLAQLHAKSGNTTYEKLREALVDYHAHSWQCDPNTSGAYASFRAGEFSNLYPYLSRPAADSKFHIVGEASSTHHAWLVGALDSAYSAVYHFLYRFNLWDFIARLKERWGEVDELEDGEFGTLHIQNWLGLQRYGQHVKLV